MAAPPGDDYYAMLGVGVDAGAVELKRAWRALAARWHPDRAGREAALTFERLAEAYRILSDPLARMAYDRRRRPPGGAGASPSPRATSTGAVDRPGTQPERPPAPA